MLAPNSLLDKDIVNGTAAYPQSYADHYGLLIENLDIECTKGLWAVGGVDSSNE